MQVNSGVCWRLSPGKVISSVILSAAVVHLTVWTLNLVAGTP